MARNVVVMKNVSAERAGAFELIQEADQGYGNRVSVDTISRRNDKIELERDKIELELAGKVDAF